MLLYHLRSIRLQGCDDFQLGAFTTICTRGREMWVGRAVDGEKVLHE